jgi:hypothetical protein
VLRSLTVLLLLMQVSGVAHLAGDLAGIDDDCSRPCEGEPPDQDCPPFCATCSCAHGRRIAVGSTVVEAPLPVLGAFDVLLLANQMPSDPDPHGIFHPPRA